METTTMVGYDYPILGFFWSMLIFFLWFAWLMLLFRIFGDIFRQKEMGGFAKALWVLFVIFLPFLGVLIYVIAHGSSMAQRDYQAAANQQQAFDDYVKQTAGTASSADELTKLAALKDQGVITDAEFAAQKAKLLT
jgi:Short C-terminal domain/Phospholipase_D-nuclease N-terminal